MTTGDGAISRRCATLGLMRQSLLFHVAKIGGASCMAGFAPSCTVAQTGIVVHSHGGPGRLAGVASHAGH